MIPLTQQLEDKKKELEGWRRSITSYIRCDECNDFLPQTEINHCIEIIAILEQAIAEKDEFVRNLKKEIPLIVLEHYGETNMDWSGFVDEREMNIEIEQNPIIEKIKKKIDEIKNIQSQQDKIEKEPLGTSSLLNAPAGISNLLQKQRQEILDKIENIIVSNLWGTENDGKSIFSDFRNFKYQQLNQPKTEK